MSGVYLARIVAKRCGQNDRAEDQQESGRKAETRPFDLLAGDPRGLPAEADDLAREDRQQDDHGQDALHVLVDVRESRRRSRAGARPE